MMSTSPLYLSPKGGSITCFRVDSGRIFRSCSASHCLYSFNLHSAKAQLDNLEFSRSLPSVKTIDPPAQRKTTLKWNVDGDLSSVDMARILERLSVPELTQCDLVSDLDEQKNQFQQPLLTNYWIPSIEKS